MDILILNIIHHNGLNRTKSSFNMTDDTKIMLLSILTSTFYTIIIINIIHNLHYFNFLISECMMPA